MKRLVLHIGPRKCASSTLQGYLTQYPVLPLDQPSGGHLRYMALTATGHLIHGEAAMRAALVGNVYGFVFSNKEALSDAATFSSVLSQIAQISGPDDTIVLSQEAWGRWDFLTPEVRNIINHAPVPVDVFMMTRPPVDWVTSAWWQGGAWADYAHEEYINKLKKINFLGLLGEWTSIERVAQVGVHDISQGPVESFLAFVGASKAAPPPEKKLNLATDFDLLRHLVRNRQHYGRTPGDPFVEFRLNGLISGARKALPSVVSRPIAYEMITRDHADNSRLIELMQENAVVPLSPEVIRRYLDPTAYDHLPEKIDFAASFNGDYSDEFVRKIIDALLMLGQQADENAVFSFGIRDFNPERYLELNPDVRGAGVDPLDHFTQFGFKEGRQLR